MKVVHSYHSQTNLLTALREQHPQAQQELYQLYAPKMLAVCKRYVSHTQQAEDILVEGFLKVFTRIESFKGQGSFESWLRKIFVNSALDFLRQQKRFLDLDSISESLIEQDAEVDYETSASEFSLETLLSLVAALDDPYGIVFSLYVLDDYSHKEISENLGISIANSKSILCRARKQLQASVTDIKKQLYGKEARI